MLAGAILLLAQARSPVAGHSNDLLRWTIVLAVGTAALILAGYLIYRIVMRTLAEPEPGPSFDLLELRRLRANGTLTQEEFEKAKSRIIAELSGNALGDAPLPEDDPGSPSTDDQTGGDDASKTPPEDAPPTA